LDFCSKDTVPDIRSDQVRLFIDKFREKRQTKAQQEQASEFLSCLFTGNFSSSPKAFIGDPVFPEKSLDSRPEALRE